MKEPRLKIKRFEQKTKQANKDDCRELVTKVKDIPEKKPPTAIRDCQNFDSLTVWLKIGNGWTAGTWSKISYSFERREKFIAAVSRPSRGSCVETKISLQDAYGSPTVAVSRVDNFIIWDIISLDPIGWIFGGDAWVLEGFRIDGKCAESSKILTYEKEIALNLEFKHEPTHPERPTPVLSTWINPGNWNAHTEAEEVLQHCGKTSEEPKQHEPPTTGPGACTHFNSLEVRLELGNGIMGLDGAGTFDDISLDIGSDSFTLAKHPRRGTGDTRKVDLKKAFGSKSVPIKDITSFRLYSTRDKRYYPDSWELAGLTFEGRCTGLSRMAKVDKYQSLHEWFNRPGYLSRVDMPSELDGRIGLKDWHYSPTHDASET